MNAEARTGPIMAGPPEGGPAATVCRADSWKALNSDCYRQPPPTAGPATRRRRDRSPIKIRDVSPVYPAIAQSAHVEGWVILEAVIDERGRVSETRVLKHVPLLDEAAETAVRQWVYSPTLLNGQPIAVVMTVTVQFSCRNDPAERREPWNPGNYF